MWELPERYEVLVQVTSFGTVEVFRVKRGPNTFHWMYHSPSQSPGGDSWYIFVVIVCTAQMEPIVKRLHMILHWWIRGG